MKSISKIKTVQYLRLYDFVEKRPINGQSVDDLKVNSDISLEEAVANGWVAIEDEQHITPLSPVFFKHAACQFYKRTFVEVSNDAREGSEILKGEKRDCSKIYVMGDLDVRGVREWSGDSDCEFSNLQGRFSNMVAMVSTRLGARAIVLEDQKHKYVFLGPYGQTLDI